MIGVWCLKCRSVIGNCLCKKKGVYDNKEDEEEDGGSDPTPERRVQLQKRFGPNPVYTALVCRDFWLDDIKKVNLDFYLFLELKNKCS